MRPCTGCIVVCKVIFSPNLQRTVNPHVISLVKNRKPSQTKSSVLNQSRSATTPAVSISLPNNWNPVFWGPRETSSTNESNGCPHTCKYFWREHVDFFRESYWDPFMSVPALKEKQGTYLRRKESSL